MYQKFIGIDIGKEIFCTALHGKKKTEEFTNNLAGFEAFCAAYHEDLVDSLIVLETTGGYEIALIKYLQAHKQAVHRANTRKVKHYIRSYGQLGKSDSIDALALARYGCDRHRELDLYVESPRKDLLKLVSRREDLKQMLVQEKNRLKAPDQALLCDSYQIMIKAFEDEMQKIQVLIDETIQADNSLQEQKKVLKGLEGIGDVVAVTLLAQLPELGHLGRRQIASLSGLAPHPNESGKKVGYRATRGGRTQIKPILFMAALSAARTDSKLGEFYKKLVDAGKKKMVALIALMRKIIVIANARLRDYFTENLNLKHS